MTCVRRLGQTYPDASKLASLLARLRLQNTVQRAAVTAELLWSVIGAVAGAVFLLP